jgi:hypothetical protein
MGKLSQYITYLNSEVYPTSLDIKHKYSHFTPDEQTKAIRREYRKRLNLKEDLK